jgi:hypothetical protein
LASGRLVLNALWHQDLFKNITVRDMKFIITIDTEGDNQWDHGRTLTVENVKYVDRFQSLCEAHGISPTYLVTSEICEDPYAQKLFSDYVKKNRAEVGAHLHSWTTPPFLPDTGFRENDENHIFASELDHDLLSEKIKNLTEQITRLIGRVPTSFRSGRYGFNETVARVLIENNFLVDSSVTPFVSWSEQRGLPGGKGGPDFIDSSPFPDQYNFKAGSLIEIPVTILPTILPLNGNHRIASYYFRNVNTNLFLRILRKLFYTSQPVWLRPTPDMTPALLKALVREARSINLPYLTMMFHSSELMPGCSKYRPDDQSIEELYTLLEIFFTALDSGGIESVTLTNAANELRS